ncbi:MAG: alkaline phosphatase family protein, partial [Candidatus Nanohaloarchaea archaeon]
GVLKSTKPPASIPAWPSMVTGRNPGKHGIYDFTYGPGHVTDTKPIYDSGPWHLYPEKDMTFLNVPGTYGLVERGFNGKVVSGLFTPSSDWESPTGYAYPEEFADEVESLFQDYHIDLWGREESKLVERADEIVEQRGALFNHVLDEHEPEFLWGVFVIPDRIMHRFWAYMDEEHPLYNQIDDDDYRRDVLREHFSQLDEKVGEVLERLDEEDTVFVVSDHGFQPTYWDFDVRSFLEDKGYLESEKEATKSLLSRLGINTRTVGNLYQKLGGEKLLDILSKDARLKLKEVYQSLPTYGENAHVDEEKSKVTLMNKGLCIRVNTESQGGPVPDEEKQEVVDAIADDLEDFMDENGLNGYVDKNFLHGGEEERGPDVCYFFDKDSVEQAEKSEYLEKYDETRAGEGAVSAWHHPDGIYIARGPGIKNVEEDAEIYDVLPTVMALLGEKVDEDYDGEVMDIFEEGFLPEIKEVELKTESGSES